MPRLSVDQLIKACGRTYRSVDIRVAAYRDGDQWRCAFAALRLTADSPAVVRARFDQLRQQHGIIRTDIFTVAYQALPFRNWKTLVADIDSGKLHISGEEVHLNALGPIGAEVNYLRTSQQHDFAIDRSPWPSLDISRGENPVGALNTDEVTKAIGGAGYSSAFQLIAVCGVNAWPNNGYGHNFFLRLPVFGSVGPVRTDPLTGTLHVDIQRHKKLTKIVARSLFTGRLWGVPHDRTVIDCKAIDEQSEEIQKLSGSVLTPGQSPDHFVEISLSHPEIGEIERQNHRIYDLLPAGERNPLFEVLKRFCPEDEFESMLVRPGAQSAKADQSAAFEQHVGWLLSLLGFSPIVLGKHEHLKSGKVQVASIDILALKDKVLLLVACTLGAPRSEDFVALWHAHLVIANETLISTTVSVVPLMVTGIINSDTFSSRGNDMGAIPILDVHRLAVLLKLLPTTALDTFDRFLADPRNCDIWLRQ